MDKEIKIRAGIFGVSGYAGQKLVELLAFHPGVDVTVGVVAPEEGTPTIADLVPRLTGVVDLTCDNKPDWAKIEKKTDLVFLALPHAVSMLFVPELLKRGKKVVDLSADFRFKNLDTYQTCYTTHSCSDLLRSAVYGLPELNRELIRKAHLIANPGCYPTSVILGLLPLAANGLLEGTVIADSKSGVTGAGRTPSLGNLYVECNENLKAYKIGEHRHCPEMEEILSSVMKGPCPVLFVPHLVPMSQGMLSTLYVRSKQKDGRTIQKLYESFYRNEPFVRIMPYGRSPATKNVVNTNYCDICVKATDGDILVVVAALDNLIKGASGQAIQNMNLMYGFPETVPFRPQ